MEILVILLGIVLVFFYFLMVQFMGSNGFVAFLAPILIAFFIPDVTGGVFFILLLVLVFAPLLLFLWFLAMIVHEAFKK